MNAAVEAYLAAPEIDAHPIADDYSLNLAAAIAGHRWASEFTGRSMRPNR